MEIFDRRRAFRLFGAVMLAGFVGMTGEVMAQSEPPPGFNPPQ